MVVKRLLFVSLWFIVYLFTRLENINDFPVFADEAFYIVRTDEMIKGNSLLSPLATATQPVFIWVSVVFRLFTLDGILGGRLVSVAAGLLSVTVLAVVAKKWWGDRAAVLIFAIYTMLPFTLVYDRLGMLESLTLAGISLGLIFPIVGIPMAILTKPVGWFVLPLSFGLFGTRRRRVMIEVGIGLAMVFITWLIASSNTSQLAYISLDKPGEHLGLNVNFLNNIYRAMHWLRAYLTDPILIMAVVGGLLAVKKMFLGKYYFQAGWIMILSALYVIFSAAVGKDYYPRYLYPILLGVILALVAFINTIIDKWRKIGWFLLILFIPTINFDYKLIYEPSEAPLALEDKFQFFEDWTSGVGANEISTEVEKIVKEKGLPISVYTENDNSYLVALLNNQKLKGVKIETASWLAEPLRTIPNAVLQEEGETLFVRNLNPDIPVDWRVEELLSVNKTSVRKVTLYRIVK